jgi:hypothetical protein
MLLTWRGRGLLAVIGFITTLASCAGLITWSVFATTAAIGLGLVVSGLVCRHFGRVWRDPEVTHSLYGIALESWGKIYLWLGVGGLVVFGLLWTAGLIYRLIKGLPLAPLWQ